MFLRNYVKKLYFTAILVTVFGIIGFAEGVLAQTTKVGFVMWDLLVIMAGPIDIM